MNAEGSHPFLDEALNVYVWKLTLIKLTKKIIEQVGYVVSPCLPRCCYPLIDIFLGGAGIYGYRFSLITLSLDKC